MNTNSKHYETLNIQPWEIMEKNFTTKEFIAYLKGNIIKYTLRSKGQDLSDAEKIKHYAEKLIEVQKERPVIAIDKPEEVTEPTLVKSKKEYTYKIGDRVLVKPKIERKTMKGTIIRTPVEDKDVFCNDNYIVELDSGYSGWKANIANKLVKSDNAWYADDAELEPLIKEEPKESYKFKVGDRVKIDSGWSSKSMKGTVIRTPVKELVQCHDCYIIELDEEEHEGWEANLKDHLVKSDRAWFVSEDDLKLIINEEPKKALEPNKWYDASIYTVDELKELLPVGTKVLVTADHDNDRNVNLEKEIVKEDKVKAVTKRRLTHDTRIGLSNDCWFRRYFKIIK